MHPCIGVCIVGARRPVTVVVSHFLGEHSVSGDKGKGYKIELGLGLSLHLNMNMAVVLKLFRQSELCLSMFL